MEFGFVDKKDFWGYLLKVEYFLTENQGQKIVEALIIMQSIDIDFMLENNMEDVLCEKGVIT